MKLSREPSDEYTIHDRSNTATDTNGPCWQGRASRSCVAKECRSQGMSGKSLKSAETNLALLLY
jgi:hypothetical protein